jgi:hypothetical protein
MVGGRARVRATMHSLVRELDRREVIPFLRAGTGCEQRDGLRLSQR